MLTVAIALRHMRERLVPATAGIEFRGETDANVQVQAPNRSVLSLEIEASETRANVPFRLTEEVTVGDVQGNALALAVDAIEKAVNGKTWFDENGASIASHRRNGPVRFSKDSGVLKSAVIEWGGECSWL